MAQGKGEEITGAIKHMKKSGALRIVIFAFAAGIILLLIGSGFFKKDEKELSKTTVNNGFEEYSSYLRESVSSICRSVSGAGEVYVMLNFEDSGELVYAQNKSGSGGDIRSEYVIVGSGSSASALYLGQKFPRLAGIGVVCLGGGDMRVKDEICSLLSSTFDLPLTRIYVAPLG